jgi:hypothetical protein
MGSLSFFSAGWWLTYPSEKYESQLEGLFHIYIYYGKSNMFQSPPTRGS